MSQATDIEADSQTRTSRALFARLSLMMFLQYFVQGAYMPVAPVYAEKALGFSATELGYFVAALTLGPILAPFVIGQLVDRVFATERVMAFCHFVGGLLMIWLYFEKSVGPVIAIAAMYSLLYVPTMMLSNALAFRHLRNSSLEFPWVRVFGTLGFIAPVPLVEWWWLRSLEGDEMHQARAIVFMVSGLTGILMSLYCVLVLPHTPPEPDKRRRYAPGVIMKLLRQREFLVFILVSFFIGANHKYFFLWNSPFLREILDSVGVFGAAEQTISAIGQVCEILVMIGLGFLIRKIGFKWTMTIGAAAYAARCYLFSSLFELEPGNMRLVLAGVGQAFHGLCFACFLATSYIFLDKIAPKDARGSMQTLYGTSVIGLGFLFGALLSGQIGELFTSDDGTRDWTRIWLVSAIMSTLCAVALAICIPSRPADETTPT